MNKTSIIDTAVLKEKVQRKSLELYPLTMCYFIKRTQKCTKLFFLSLQNRRKKRMITYNVDGVKMPKIKKRDTSAWIRKVAASHGRKVGEIGYMFVDDEKILEVNNEYLGHDYYTDVITFDYDEDDVINGDIVISLDTVRTNAEKFGKTYDDELHRVIIHGILHLCGINDKGPGEREIMEENENKALALLEGASILR